MDTADDLQKLHDVALKLMHAALTAEESERAAVYMDSTLQPAGAVQAGSTTVAMDEPSCTLFIDGKPGGNWMHPCRYLLVAPATGNTRSVDAQQPPAFGPLPPSWSLLWRAPAVEDWQLLPLSDPTS